MHSVICAEIVENGRLMMSDIKDTPPLHAEQFYRLEGMLSKKDVEYLIYRLECVKSLLLDGEVHIAIAKIMADISALSAAVEE